LLDRIDNDRQLFDELVAVFLDDTETRLAAIKIAIERGDHEALRRAAHAIKGAAANVGARRVFSTAACLEAASTSPNNGVRDLYAELTGDFDRLQTQLAGARA
jgi:HPt (histidine-containing phosphotransfer) domain-containing protein